MSATFLFNAVFGFLLGWFLCDLYRMWRRR